MKKVALLTIISLIFSFNINAETIAYWRFEEGSSGVQHTGTNDDFYVDSTANSNAMSNIPTENAPTATSTVPFSTVPATGEPNTLALDFVPNSVILTQNSITNKMVDSYVFSNGWTIEATVKFNAGFGTAESFGPIIVGKDGKPSGGPAPPFFLKLIKFDPPFIQADFFSDDNVEHWFDGRSGFGGSGETEIFADKWYNLAVTYDGSNVAKLYIQEETDIEYELEATSQQSNIGPATFPWDTHWTIGRGVSGGAAANWVNGTIDEVRISNEPLNPTQFLAYTEVLTPQPPVIKNVTYSPSPEPSSEDTVQISAKITTLNSTLTNVYYTYNVNSGIEQGPFPMTTNGIPNIYVGNVVSQAPYSTVLFTIGAVNADGLSSSTGSTYTVYEDISWKSVVVTPDAMGGGWNMQGIALAPNGLAGFVYKSAANNFAYYVEETSLGVIGTPSQITTDSQGFNSHIAFGTNGDAMVALSYDEEPNPGGLSYLQRTNSVWTDPMIIVTNHFDEFRSVIAVGNNLKPSVLWYNDDGFEGTLISIITPDSYSSVEITNEVSSKTGALTRQPFGLLYGSDDKRRIALSYTEAGTINPRLSYGIEDAVDSGIFSWETVSTNKVYAEQMGFALDANNNAYIVCRDESSPPSHAVLFENSSGSWLKHELDPMGHWGHCAVAVNPYDGTVWVAHNIADEISPNGFKLWSNRADPNIWLKEQSITNGIYIDAIAGFGITELGTMKIAFKPDFATANLVYMYSTKFTIPEPMIFWILNFGFWILLRKFKFGKI